MFFSLKLWWHVSSTFQDFPSIQADFNSAMVWMILILSLISCSHNFSDLLRTFQKHWYHYHLHVPMVFQLLENSRYLFSFLLSFYFTHFHHQYYFTHLRLFLTNISWWFSTAVWMTVSLLKSPELSLVFWLISIMM